MNTMALRKQFARLGARLEVIEARGQALVLDINTDRKGEHFEIQVDDEVELTVVNVRPDIKHLVLHAEVDGRKGKYLCGHDERHWFVARVPDAPGVSTVDTALEALKPRAVRGVQALGLEPQVGQAAGPLPQLAAGAAQGVAHAGRLDLLPEEYEEQAGGRHAGPQGSRLAHLPSKTREGLSEPLPSNRRAPRRVGAHQIGPFSAPSLCLPSA